METRIKVVLLVALLLVACGFGAIYFTNKYLKSVSPTPMSNRVQEPENIKTGNIPAAEEKTSAAETDNGMCGRQQQYNRQESGSVKEMKDRKAALNPSPVLKEIPLQEERNPSSNRCRKRPSTEKQRCKYYCRHNQEVSSIREIREDMGPRRNLKKRKRCRPLYRKVL